MSTKDYIEKDYYKALGVAKDASRGRDQEGLPQAGPRAAPGQEPGRREGRGAVQGGLRGLRRALRRGEAQGVRRGPQPVRRGGGFGGFPGGGAAAARTDAGFDMSDLFGGGAGGGGGLGDLFDGLFGARRRATDRGAARRAGTRPGRQRRGDTRFEQAVRGATLPLRLSEPGDLPHLPRHRRAARHGAAPLPELRRHRLRQPQPGRVRVQRAVRECRGTGQIIDDPCPECGGSGVTSQTRTITVRDPGRRARRRQDAHGRQGHAGRARRAGRRPVRHRPRRRAPAVRPQRRRPDADRADQLRRGRARHHAAGADARRLGGAQGRAGHAVRPHAAGARARRASASGDTGDLLVTVEVAVPPQLDDDAREALRGVRRRRRRAIRARRSPPRWARPRTG